MIKVEVIEDFSLADYNLLKNIVRKGKEQQGKLFKGDIFECDEEMANYLSGSNALKRPFIKVIEILPKEKPASTKLDLEDVKVIAEEVNKAVKKTTKKSKK